MSSLGFHLTLEQLVSSLAWKYVHMEEYLIGKHQNNGLITPFGLALFLSTFCLTRVDSSGQYVCMNEYVVRLFSQNWTPNRIFQNPSRSMMVHSLMPFHCFIQWLCDEFCDDIISSVRRFF